MLLSIIVPCFNEEEALPIFYHTMRKYEDQISADIEYCFIDDGSKDSTLNIMRKLCDTDSRVHYWSFSRNFGKEAALLAGLKMARGSYVATMDVDLQDPPELLPEMFNILTKSDSTYDCVATRRKTRTGEPAIRSFFARRFYRLMNRISDTKIIDGARDYRMMSRRMVDAIVADGEYNRFSKGIFSWVGFETYWISYENIERSAGKTKWSFWGLFKYAVDGILAYSVAPLYLELILGISMCSIGLILLIVDIFNSIVTKYSAMSWASLLSIIIFVGGIMMSGIGTLGLYISKIYTETKKRQVYIIKEEK